MTNEERMAGFTSKPYFSKPKSYRATDHRIRNTPRYFFWAYVFPQCIDTKKIPKYHRYQKYHQYL